MIAVITSSQNFTLFKIQEAVKRKPQHTTVENQVRRGKECTA